MKLNRKQSYFLGYLGEYIAIFYLWIKGYRIISTRYKTFVGEIDIIACRRKVIIFCEVKSRMYNVESYDEIFPYRQQQRVKKAAMNFITRNPRYKNYEIRFDFIFIKYLLIVKHLPDAWR